MRDMSEARSAAPEVLCPTGRRLGVNTKIRVHQPWTLHVGPDCTCPPTKPTPDPTEPNPTTRSNRQTAKLARVLKIQAPE